MSDAATLPAGQKTAAADVPALPFKLILIALCMAQFINAYDTTAMNVAVTSVVKSLGTTVSGVQSALVLYSLVMASFMLIGGKLGDVWGRRATFTIGISMYGVGALITAFSMGLPMMIVGWSLLEGLGSALMIPAIFAIVGTIFPAGKPRVSAFAAVGAMAAMGAALGPLICGFLTTYLTWRVSFLLEVCVVLATLALTTRIKVPKTKRPAAKLDYLGAFLSALGLALVVLGVLQAGKFGWTAARVPMIGWGRTLIPEGGISPVIPFVVAGVVVLLLFAVWERHMLKAGKDALLNIGMLKKRAVLFGLLAIIAFMFMQAGFLFVTPVFMQMALGYTAFHSGLLILPMTIMIILVATRVSKLTQIIAPKLIVQVGMLVLVGGILLIALELKATAQQWEFLPGMIVAGIGIGLINAPLMNITQGAVPAKEQSEISGLSRAMSNLGGAFGTADRRRRAHEHAHRDLLGRRRAVQRHTGEREGARRPRPALRRADRQQLPGHHLPEEQERAGRAGAEVRGVQPGRTQQGPAERARRHRVLGLFGFVMSCFLPGGKSKKPAAEPEANAPPASA